MADEKLDEQAWFVSVALDHEEYLSAEGWDAAPNTQDVPTKENRYQKTTLLGEGGMGRVWLGWDTEIERNVAIKEPLGGSSSSHARRLRREVMLTAKLDHPGVAAVHDVFYEDDVPMFVMTLIRGKTFAQQRKDKTHKRDRVRLIRHILSVCEIIGHAHKRGVIHRDLTPRNILIDDSGVARVIDWGMALTLQEAAMAPPAAGTPGFMSPEQCHGEALDARTDVWGLGALLHLVLHGKPPSQEGKTPAQGAVETICAKALQQDPEQRYPSAMELAEDLVCWFEGRQVSAMEASLWQTMKWAIRRHHKKLLLVAMALVILCATIAAGVIRTRAETTRAKRAEGVAVLQRERADEATERANQEVLITKSMLADVQVRAATQALDNGNVSKARRLLAQANELKRSALGLGLEMRLALIPAMEKKHERTLPECRGKWQLTTDPLVTLCHSRPLQIDAWRGQEKIWRADLGPQLRALGNESINHWRVSERELVVRANLSGALAVDLRTGEVSERHEGASTFASETNTHLLENNRWVDRLETFPCTQRVIRVTRTKRHRVYLCQEGDVWLKENGKRAQKLYGGVAGLAAHHVYIESTGEHWVGTSDGELWPLGRYDRRVKLGSPLRYMKKIPGTKFLVVRSWAGEWQILDTEQGGWITSFDAIQALNPTQDGMVQVLKGNVLQLWSTPTKPIRRHYKSPYGFTDVAWSMDGDVLAATDGGGFLRWFTPRSLNQNVQPTQYGEGVLKSVTPLDSKSFMAIGVGREPGVGLSKFRRQGDRVVHEEIVPERKTSGVGRRLESLGEHGFVVITTAETLYRSSRPPGKEWHSVALSKPHEFLDLTSTIDRQRVMAVGKKSLIFLEASGQSYEVPTPVEGAYYGALSSDGRFALSTPKEVHVYSKTGTRLHTLPVPTRAMSLAWRTNTDQLIVGDLKGTISIWDTSNGELLTQIEGHQGRVSAMSISPNGNLLASASWDTTVRLLSFKPLDRLFK